MEDKRMKLLKDEPVRKAILTLSGPAILGLLVMAVYNVVDTMFVSWIGTQATGATQVVFPIMMLISSVGLGFGVGGGSYVSRLYGQGEKELADKVVSTSFLTTVGLGILFTVLGIVFLEPILYFFGASDSIIEVGKEYGFYIILGSVFQMGNMAMNNLLRAEGSAKVSMIGMVIGAVINIVLDPILIFGFDMGVAGAAIATTFSQIITFSILLYQYMGGKSVAVISLRLFTPTRLVCNEILKIGSPTFFRQVLVSISVGIMNQSAVAIGGDNLLAAVGIISKIGMLPMFVLFGLGQGFQPLAGFNYGANNMKRVLDALDVTIMISMVISFICSAAIFVLAPQFMVLFKASAEVAELGIRGLRYYSIAIIMLGFTNTVGVLYQSLGMSLQAMLLSVSRQGLFYIPVVLLLPKFLGEEGILLSQTVADVLTLVLTLVMFIPFYIKMRRDVREPVEIGLGLSLGDYNG